jgi:hypothetical protein
MMLGSLTKLLEKELKNRVTNNQEIVIARVDRTMEHADLVA